MQGESKILWHLIVALPIIGYMPEIEKGTPIRVRDVHGHWLERIAMGGVVQGRDFPVVWACRSEERERATREGDEPVGAPWPAEDVEPAVLA
jgi:hypothetical protein